MSEGTPIVDVSAEPMTLTIGGREYKLPPLSMGDIAAAERWIIDQRLNAVLERTRMPPLPDDVRAKAIAAVLASPVQLADILLSYEGRLRLLYLSMRRADHAIRWEFVKEGMPAVATLVLTELMYKLAGLGAKMGDEADPMTTTPEPGGDPKNGTQS